MYSSFSSSIHLPTSYAGHGEQSSPDILFLNNLLQLFLCSNIPAQRCNPSSESWDCPAVSPPSVMPEAYGGTQGSGPFFPSDQNIYTCFSGGVAPFTVPLRSIESSFCNALRSANMVGNLISASRIQQYDPFSYMCCTTQHLWPQMKDGFIEIQSFGSSLA